MSYEGYIQDQLSRIGIYPASKGYSWEAALDAAVNECERMRAVLEAKETEIGRLRQALHAHSDATRGNV